MKFNEEKSSVGSHLLELNILHGGILYKYLLIVSYLKIPP